MTYGLCADCHFHSWSLFSSQNDQGVNTRLQGQLDEFRRLCEETKKAGGERVYVAGDIFHVRGTLKTSVLNPVVSEFICCANELGIQIRVMAGNHDLEGAEVTFAGNATIQLAHSTCDDEPEIEVVQYPKFFEDDKVAIVPWQNTREGMINAVEELKKDITKFSDCKVEDCDLHLHTGINGVIIGMPDHGWSPEELADFGFKRVFSGHYHQHKVFEVDDCQVVSIGALTHQTWSDVGTTAGWVLVDEESFEQFEAKTPKFLDLDDDFEVEDAAGNYIRVRGVEMEEKEIRELRDALQDAGAKGVVIHAVAKSKVTTRSGKSAGKAVKMEESINDWITANEEIEEKSRSEVNKLALEVLSEARAAE